MSAFCTPFPPPTYASPVDPLGPTTCADFAPSRETASQNTGFLYLTRRTFSLDAIKKKIAFKPSTVSSFVTSRLTEGKGKFKVHLDYAVGRCVSCRRAAESRPFHCTFKQLPNLQASPRRPSLNVAHLLVWVCFISQSTLSRPDVYPELCAHYSYALYMCVFREASNTLGSLTLHLQRKVSSV